MTWVPPDRPGPAGPASSAWGAPPAPAAATRPPGRRSRGRVALVLGLVVLLVAGGVWGGTRWQASRAREALARGFDQVHAAFLTGDCRAAAARYRSLDRPGSMPARDRPAKQELAGCAALERVRTAAGDPGDRVVGYLDLLRDTPAGPLVTVARGELADLLRAPATDLATDRLCRRNDQLEQPGTLSPAERGRVLPALLLACGTAPGTTGQAAEFYLQQLLDDYPKAEEVQAGIRSLASLVIAADPEPERRAFTGVGELRRDRSLGGRAELLVYNQGPRELQVAALGPDASSVGKVPGCPTCRPYYGPDVQVDCTWQGRPLKLVLPAGDYRTAVRYAAQGGARSGILTLRPGRVYRTCIWPIG